MLSVLCVFTGLEPSLYKWPHYRLHAADLAPLRFPRSFTAYSLLKHRIYASNTPLCVGWLIIAPQL